MAESNIEREGHGIATEEKTEIVFSQPVLAYVDTDEAKDNASLSHSLEIETQ